MKRSLLLFLMAFALLFITCKKNRLNGKSTISGRVMHHSKAIAFARVFIKFGTTDFPGRDTTAYDAKVVADASGNYTIKCYKGDYYLYGAGFDDQIQLPPPYNVFGGLAVHIRNKEHVSVDVAVTE